MDEKITVDVLMFIAIILEFAGLPILIHEIIGIGLIFLIILHINFNKNYFKAIPKGKYNNHFRHFIQPKLIEKYENRKSQNLTCPQILFNPEPDISGAASSDYPQKAVKKTEKTALILFLNISDH